MTLISFKNEYKFCIDYKNDVELQNNRDPSKRIFK